MAQLEVREPQAGIWGFYPLNRGELLRTIEACLLDKRFGPGRLPDRNARPRYTPVGGVVPHAGYSYSGPCAAHLYLELAENAPEVDTVVVMGTNHTGYGGVYTTTTRYKAWATPLGTVETDIEFIELLKKLYPRLEDDYLAHMREHSIEVELPFLQYIYGNNFKLVPIVVKEPSERMAREMAEAVKRAAEELGRRILVIASSDFTHHGYMYDYVLFTENVRENVAKLDMAIIEHILRLDTKGFLETIYRYGATVCGYGAIATLIEYAKLEGARAKLLKYYNSADVTGDEAAVVGYAAILFHL
ncbi:AmmeMemoRadiSam system protein B [Hyperthermus butylicus]|uniref:MEMO1 family protein Hbut_1421 n=1 Tax=Hyperthermus butylicus (strain DSM 5456 / JCM 9403 / PLM1-5) TaxID=415426 RepID=A2BMN4_HYPBU|nr:AmmeMemoRadiSam system protein B [Hyperthermus butylicus]ABM81245.1 putative dioxygenase [Hyperthermus butylicus DSM 5456]